MGPQTGPKEIAQCLLQNFTNVVHPEAGSLDKLGWQMKKRFHVG